MLTLDVERQPGILPQSTRGARGVARNTLATHTAPAGVGDRRRSCRDASSAAIAVACEGRSARRRATASVRNRAAPVGVRR